MAELNTLSPTAQRWMGFFGLRTVEDVLAALRTRIIAPGRRPGLTNAVVEELTQWAAPTSEFDHGPLPTPTRMTEIVTYFQCDDSAHRHLQFNEAQQCMVASRDTAERQVQRMLAFPPTRQ